MSGTQWILMHLCGHPIGAFASVEEASAELAKRSAALAVEMSGGTFTPGYTRDNAMYIVPVEVAK